MGRPLHHLAILCLAGSLALAATPAGAANHALLMWIATYADPSAKLQGIEKDARRARELATQLGTPPANVIERRNEDLTFLGMRSALAELRSRVRSGDKVFIYFSGHGARHARAGEPGCQQGLVTHEGRLMLDAVLRHELEQIARDASQVVMFTDACHSGGVVGKSPDLLIGDAAVQTKAYPVDLLEETSLSDKSGTALAANNLCAMQVNLPKQLPGRGTSPADGPARRIFHLAASAENEAAFATAQGSLATQAWAACLVEQRSTLTGEALARCAQNWIDTQRPLRRQTVTPSLNARLVLTPQDGR